MARALGEGAGMVLHAAMEAEMSRAAQSSAGGFCCSDALESIILRTSLASSMVAYLERFPWTAVTSLRVEPDSGGPSLFAATICGALLDLLSRVADASRWKSGRNQVPDLLLWQVRGPNPPPPGIAAARQEDRTCKITGRVLQ